jgi:hypothetical protein
MSNDVVLMNRKGVGFFKYLKFCEPHHAWIPFLCMQFCPESNGALQVRTLFITQNS